MTIFQEVTLLADDGKFASGTEATFPREEIINICGSVNSEKSGPLSTLILVSVEKSMIADMVRDANPVLQGRCYCYFY